MDDERIVGLVGWTGCGKDSLGDALRDKHGWKVVGFADELKQMMLAIDPVYHGKLDVLEYYKRTSGDPTRKKLQALGEYMRRDEPAYWVRKAAPKVGLFLDWSHTFLRHHKDAPYLPVLFTDCRHKNEADIIHESGGVIIHIDRPGCGPINAHSTETGTQDCIDRADHRLINNDTIATLVDDFLTCV